MAQFVQPKPRLPENEAKLIMIDLQQARAATQSKKCLKYLDRVMRTLIHYYGLPYLIEDDQAVEAAGNRSGQT